MRPTLLRPTTLPLLLLLTSATACVEEETVDAPESGSLSSVSNNLETPEPAAAEEERAPESDDDGGDDGANDDVAATEGDAPAAEAIYRGYACSNDYGQLIESVGISLEEALDNCRLNDLYNPQFRGMRCTLDEETIYDSCATAEGDAPADEQPAIDQACYLDCRSIANAVI